MIRNFSSEFGKIEKGIVLYGIGLEGDKFYSKYHNKYKFVCALDREIMDFHNLEIRSTDDAACLSKDYYIVVAVGEKYYLEIKKTLESIGLKEYKDFIWNKEFGKKLLLIYGNCHFVPIISYMKQQVDVQKNYAIRYYRIGSDNYKQYPNECELYYCHVFITQDIRESNSRNVPGYESLIKKVRINNCKVVIVPNLYGLNLFFPQYKKDYSMTNDKLNEYKRKGKKLTPEQIDILNGLSSVRDENIDYLYSRGYNVEMIYNYLNGKEVYDKDNIIENFETQMNKLKIREKKCSICISDYIEENYKNKQLFYEPEHPTNELLIEFSFRIMDFLNIEIDNISYSDEDCLDSREIFIYENVRDILELKYEQKYIRKHQAYSTLGNTPLNFKEYIEEYVLWFFEE